MDDTEGKESPEAIAKRQRQLSGLRPWKKGQSGNPSGRSSLVRDIQDRFGKDVPLILERLKLIALKDNGPIGIMAAREFLDRVCGKVPQAVAVKQLGENGERVIDITPEQALDRIRHASEVVDRAKALGVEELPTAKKGPELSVVPAEAQAKK